MHCPTDGTVLQLAERHGIEIDYCPACRGVWLDRGELDKILDRAAADDHDRPREPAPLFRTRTVFDDDDHDHDDDHRRWGDQPGRHRSKRKKSFLSDLFEFGD